MNQSQLWHAIRTACAILDRDGVIVVGSQSILATYSEDNLPSEATESMEVDILARGATVEDTKDNADRLSGAAGELSPFDVTHGFRLDGVDDSTAVVPADWESRLVVASNPETFDIVRQRQYTGWCLEPHDLCVAKLIAFREKDRRFVAALVKAGLVDTATIIARLATVPGDHAAAAANAVTWLDGFASGQ
jgi:hypothetical protein